jgi:hypothetical protein
MTTDRELLEAAFAVNRGSWHPLTHDTPGGRPWNPRSFMGDALLLADALGLAIDVGAESVRVSKGGQGVTERLGQDPGDATRRAIVRAAAATAPHI